MIREFPFEEFSVCDVCGNIGAYDIMGDYFCSNCLPDVDSDYDLDDYDEYDEDSIFVDSYNVVKGYRNEWNPR